MQGINPKPGSISRRLRPIKYVDTNMREPRDCRNACKCTVGQLLCQAIGKRPNDILPYVRAVGNVFHDSRASPGSVFPFFFSRFFFSLFSKFIVFFFFPCLFANDIVFITVGKDDR